MAEATLRVYRDPPLDGPTNMARDECLLYSAEIGAAADGRCPAALRFYAWTPPTISLGCFQRFAAVAELPADVRGLPIVRRPTGGGAILHDREITYCLVLDDSIAAARQSPVALYRLVHECWRAAIVDRRKRAPTPPQPAPELAPDSMPLPSPRSGPFFCFEKPGKTDLLLGDRKLLGSAQRRIPGRVLQHGSLLLEQRFASHPGVALELVSSAEVESLKDVFIRELAGRFGLAPVIGEWTHEQSRDSDQRRARFSSDDWTKRH